MTYAVTSDASQGRCSHGLPPQFCALCTADYRRTRRALAIGPGGPQSVRPHETISATAAEEFFSALKDLLEPLQLSDIKSVRLARHTRRGIAVSFDRDWQPFLGHTLGYNGPTKPPRLPLSVPTRVLGVVETWLKRLELGPPGGRVFLSKCGVITYRQEVGSWDWHGECPLSRLNALRDSLALRAELQRLHLESQAEIKRLHQKSEYRDVARKAAFDALVAERKGDAVAAAHYWLQTRTCLADVGLDAEFEQLREQAETLLLQAFNLLDLIKGRTPHE